MADPAKILDEALSLDDVARAELARALIESLDGADEDAADAWREEIRRRIDEMDRGDAQSEDWGTVRRRLRASVER